MKIRLADFVIDFLYKKNIKKIFTVSGGGSIFLCDALYKSKKVEYIACHHEQAVSFAAESYARQSNSVGGAVVTSGPGGTNSLTGTASAWIDSVPVFFVSGQVFLNQTIGKTGVRQLGVQEIDIISLVKPITKYSVMIEKPNEILYHLEKAYDLCNSGRPGPVWIDIPANIQNAIIDNKNLIQYKKKIIVKNNINEEKKLKILANKLLNSERPLFHFGHGVKLSKSSTLVKKFISKHKIPFALTWNASDLIESSNKFYTGRPGTFAERGSNFIVQNCDLFISVGSRLPFMVTGYNSKDFARLAYRVVVDIDKNEVNKKSIDFNLRINMDAKDFLKKLDKIITKKKKQNPKWIQYCQKIRQKYPIVLDEFKKNNKYVNSYYFIEQLSKILEGGDTVVTDMGLSFIGTHQSFFVKKNQNVYTNSGHAPMGWGLPAAVGASIAKSKKMVVCLVGDGGLQLNIQEFATIMHHKLPIKIFIYNNGGYLTIKQTQELGFGGRIMGSNKKSGLSFPNYKKIAEAHKIDYFRIKNNKDIFKNLKKIIKIKKPVICELIMDHNQVQMPKAINRRLPNGKTEATVFEDMYPFLKKEELLEASYANFIKEEKK